MGLTWLPCGACSKDDLKLGFHFQKPKQQIAYLSELGTEDVAAVASFEIPPGAQPSFEGLLDDTTDRQDALDTNNELGDARVEYITDEPIASEGVVDERQEAPAGESSAAPLVVLAFSCIAAFLALACIALTLYIIKSLRSQMLASKTAWELLPRFWRRPSSKEDNSAIAKDRRLGTGCLLFQTEIEQQRLLDAEEGSAQRRDLHPGDRPLYSDAISDMGSEWDDVDEKYQDALDMTPLPLIHGLPLDDNVSHFDDPPLPSLGSCPLDQPTADRSTPLVRGLCSPNDARPAWSVRAIDSPALGLSSREGGVDATPQLLIHPRRRAYRSPVPEFDIALAMQLRPGLGIGADSAWMVRFLMAIFGWFTVALTGTAR